LSAVPLIALACLLGLVSGSFLNVVIARVTVGPAHRIGWPCPHWTGRIAIGDAIPVISWLVRRGRCRRCAAPIARQGPLVELACAAAFGLVAAWQGDSWALPAYFYLAAIGLALTVIDIKVRRLPDAIVLPAYGVLPVLLAVAAGLEDRWPDLLRAGAAGLTLAVFYLVVCWLAPRGMGLGDAKLAGVLGMGLGWLGWGPLALGFLAPFLLGAMAGLVTMAVRRSGRKTTIPFGPWMCLGTALGCAIGGSAWARYLELLGL
jgi:leader peptidase (prepilin peptidase)/N-methyltransferase